MDRAEDRLRGLATQLAPAAAVQQQPDEQPAPRLLSEAELRQWTEEGLLVLPNLVDSGQISEAFCEQFQRTSFENRGESRLVGRTSKHEKSERESFAAWHASRTS